VSLALHLRIAGLGLIVLAFAHLAFPKQFHWKGELARLSPLNRQIFLVHTFFIALVLVLFGAVSLLFPDALLTPSPLSRAVLAGLTLFWALRLYVQLFVYDRALWRGNRLYTCFHVLFAAGRPGRQRHGVLDLSGRGVRHGTRPPARLNVSPSHLIKPRYDLSGARQQLGVDPDREYTRAPSTAGTTPERSWAMPIRVMAVACVASMPVLASAEDLAADKRSAWTWIDQNASGLKSLNQRIWSHAEVGLQEHKSAGELIAFLRANGFTVREGVAGMPTAFVASFGSGRPVIGMLAEYDALPGLSQQAAPERKPREGVEAGHGCGHSVFGTASTGAAVAVKQVLATRRTPGTVRLYGTPAEETGIGKIYMLRDGLFDDADVVLAWHADDRSATTFSYSKALVSMKYRFRGLPAHASTSPHQGRSALDAVELMNVAANYLREHVKEDTRIHYVVTRGGGQPNVVPPEAEVWYYLRANKHADVETNFKRLAEIAQGAALMTGTTVETSVQSDTHEVLPNRPLAEAIQRNLELVGPPRFSDEEKAFARKTQADLSPPPEAALAEAVDPLPAEPIQEAHSTDVGDVSWKVPVGQLTAATYSLGAPGHSWQIVACTGMSIGEKGMLTAAKVLAASALDVVTRPELVAAARKDLEARKAGYAFVSLIPEGQHAPTTIQ
jgi:aminobenzoyl-glutamate utilization protein B